MFRKDYRNDVQSDLFRAGRTRSSLHCRQHAYPPFYPPPPTSHNVAFAQTADTPTPVPTAIPTPEQPDEKSLRDLMALEGKLNPPQYPNMDSNLSRIVQDAEASGFTAQAMTAAARSAPIHREQSVAVTLYIEEGYADAISAYLSDNGASPLNIGADYIEAYIPVSLLSAASEREGVIRIRTIIPPQPAQGTVVSQGAAAHGVPAWHASDVRGQGVKIGVIDIGFEGFSALMGAELPATVQARCYTDIGAFTSNLADCTDSEDAETTRNHGTAVTEPIFDIAPEATYYISNPISWGDLQNTIQWMVAQDVDVINHSVIWGWDGPGDGTSPFNSSPLRTVDAAVANGITWVNAAGNGAITTWYGSFSDTDSDGWHNFSGNVECNDVELYAGEEYHAQLRWDDRWGNGLSGATRDLDLYLFDPLLLSFNINLAVSSSEFEQSGGGEDDPFEFLTFTPVSDGTYCLAIGHFGGAAPSWIQLNNLTQQDLEHHTGSGSIESPAESANPGMLAVGATHYWNTHTIADYSSQGPTPDGRVKPDIVGAACGKIATDEKYDYHHLRDGQDCWFAGTSASSPHVAGLAALVKQRFLEYSPVQVVRYLKDHAEERGAAGADNIWGHGFAKLLASDAPAPTQSVGELEMEALVALYNATNGAGWTDSTNWLNDGVPINSWHGVGTDTEGRVVNLSLPGNNLVGPLPAELGNLTKLRHLGLAGNQISGAIPVKLGSLTNLTGLYLGYNQLTGAVPGELANLVNLERLHLDNNQLSGAIQLEFGYLSKMKTLYLQGNQLTGALPSTFMQLTTLEVFAFSNGEAGLCAPTDDAFQTWLQGISNQQLAVGVTPLGPNCADSTASPTPVLTVTPTSTPQTPQPTPTEAPAETPVAPAVPEEVLNRISALETLVATLQGLISTLESSISALNSSVSALAGRVAALEADTSSPQPTPTQTPVVPTPTPTAVPGETPVPTPTQTPVADACLTGIASDGTTNGRWSSACTTDRNLITANAPVGTRYAGYYTFALSRESEVTITLESSKDTYLFLLSGHGRSGDVIEQNDDIDTDAGDYNSRIVAAPAAGEYTILATTYDLATSGDFMLTVSGMR